MTTVYLLTTDGEITKFLISETHFESNVFEEIDPELTHLICIDEIFIACHEDNDFLENYQKTEQPINAALKKYFPDSKIVGDIIIFKMTDDDMFVQNFSMDELKEYYIDFSFNKRIGTFERKEY